MNQRLDVNGSDNKPFPQERNFVMGTALDGEVNNSNPSMVVTQKDHGNVANEFGQVKYARREGAKSIYKDETRATENDMRASKKAESSTLYEVEGDEESQGI